MWQIKYEVLTRNPLFSYPKNSKRCQSIVGFYILFQHIYKREAKRVCQIFLKPSDTLLTVQECMKFTRQIHERRVSVICTCKCTRSTQQLCIYFVTK